MRRREQEVCSLCGQELPGGGIEILDGAICRDCAASLSPWYTDELEYAEAEELQAQLDAREENLQKVADFHPTRAFGENMKILVDDEARTFAVTDSRDLMADNPDILRIEDVYYSCVSADKEREEIGDGLYRYTYRFEVEIDMDEPEYISEIKFPLNDEPLSYESREKGFLGLGGFDPEGQPDYDRLAALGEKIENVLDGEDHGTDDDRYAIDENDFFAEEDQVEQVPEQDPYAPGRVVKCPWCGCNTRIGEKLSCEHCGGPL